MWEFQRKNNVISEMIRFQYAMTSEHLTVSPLELEMVELEENQDVTSDHADISSIPSSLASFGNRVNIHTDGNR